MGVNNFFSCVPQRAKILFDDSAVFMSADEGETVGAWNKRYGVAQKKALADVDHLVVDAEGIIFKFPGNDMELAFKKSLIELAERMVRVKLMPLAQATTKRLTILFDDGKRTPKLKELEQNQRDKTTRKKRPGRTVSPMLAQRTLIPEQSLGHHVVMSDQSEPVSAAALYQFFVHHRNCRRGMKELVIDALLAQAPEWAADFGIDIVVRTNRKDAPVTVIGKPKAKDDFVRPYMLGEAEAAAFQVIAQARGSFKHQAVVTMSSDTDVVAFAMQMREWEADSRLTVCVHTRANACILDVNRLQKKTSHTRRVATGVCLSLLGTDYVRRDKLEILSHKRNQTLLGLVDKFQDAIVIDDRNRVSVDMDLVAAELCKSLLTNRGPAIPVRGHWLDRIGFQVRYWASSDWTAAEDLAWAETGTDVAPKDSVLKVLVHPDHIGEPIAKRAKRAAPETETSETTPED